MARCSRLSPIPISMELQNAMNITLEMFRSERDPRRTNAWHHVKSSPELVEPFPSRHRRTSALPACPYATFVATPTSPGTMTTPEKPYVPTRPTKLDFSPELQDTF